MTNFSSMTSEQLAELWAALALRHAQGITALRAKALFDLYGSCFAAVDIGRKSPGCWVDDGLISQKTAQQFSSENWRIKAEQEWRALQKCNCSLLLISNDNYPELLKETVDAPLLLYCRGDVSLLSNVMLGIVGSRNCTQDGAQVCARFARDLSMSGITVVSGMAKGIDRAAHIAGLQGPGRSVGVLGTGIDVQYPVKNADVAELMVEKGLLVTEFAPGTPPLPQNFPIRNRIISGMSYGILVAEASRRSGSLITTRLAIEQNREVFVVPGHTLGQEFEGCHNLIRSGAKAVFNVDDILLELRGVLPLVQQSVVRGMPDNDTIAFDKPSDSSFSLPLFSHEKPASKNKRKPEQEQEKKNILGKGSSALLASAGVRTDDVPDTGEPLEPPAVPLSDEEKTIFAALAQHPMKIDELCEALDADVAQLSACLVMLEVKGLVSCGSGMTYSLVRQGLL